MVFTCDNCDRNFTSLRGLNIHRSSCVRNYVNRTQSHYDATLEDDLNYNNEDIETAMIVNMDEILIEREIIITPNLPSYKKCNEITSSVTINNTPGDRYEHLINSAYNETIFWRKNLFMLPSGKAGKSLIRELTFWLDQFNRETKLYGIALKVFMLIPNLLMQKPSQQSKAKEHNNKLSERLQLWKEGNIETLLKEGRTIQKRLTSGKSRKQTDISRIFAKLMMEGKVTAAIKFLSDNSDVGVLPASNEVIQELKTKHPHPALIQNETLLNGPINKVENSYFDNINEDMTKLAARRTKGAAGPSKLDAEQFKNILVSNRYRHEGKELREQIALLARKLATTTVDPSAIEALIACNLIPLNKNPGVRPIGVGETLRRIIGKAIGWVLKNDIQEAAGPLQVATGLESGAEAAIHAMKEIFEDDNCEAVILVDASNAFNSLNRQVALHNIQYICPQFATILINTYRNHSRLIINNEKEILSQEGTTQGDNLAMSFYALSTTLMQGTLRSIPSVKQVWLADDATGAGKITPLRQWWDIITTEGNKCGYYVNESKSWITLKDELKLEEAKSVFAGSSLRFTTAGKRHLGASIGTTDFRREYATEKISQWCEEVKKLAEIAISEPQAAYAAYTHGEMLKFNYFMRTIPGMEEYLDPLDAIINDQFLPALLGTTITEQERQLFKLPVKDGGLGMPVLVEKANIDFQSSKFITAPLVAVIVSQDYNIPRKML